MNIAVPEALNGKQCAPQVTTIQEAKGHAGLS